MDEVVQPRMKTDGNLRRTALLFLLFDHLGEVNGRTKLQKLTYLADLLGWGINDHVFYQYGPYSEWVTNKLDSFVENGWVSEKRKVFGEDSRVIYNYKLTDAGRNIANGILGDTDDNELVSKTMKLFDQFSGFKAEDLEIMASLVFLKRSNSSLTNRQLVRLVRRLKPMYSIKHIQESLRVFELLSEVTA